MIKIKCKKCGWILPFSAKANKDSVQDRGGQNIVCPKCGELLVQKGGKAGRWY
jgi:ribosomal protein S27E